MNRPITFGHLLYLPFIVVGVIVVYTMLACLLDGACGDARLSNRDYREFMGEPYSGYEMGCSRGHGVHYRNDTGATTTITVGKSDTLVCSSGETYIVASTTP